MENASKALLITGAVVIAIILVSMGVMIVQNTSGLIGQTTERFSSQEIQMFNSDFENYGGTQKGSSVSSLMSKISASNATHDEEHQIAVTLNGSDAKPDEISAYVRSTSSYEVTIERNPKSALIEKINITKPDAEKKDK